RGSVAEARGCAGVRARAFAEPPAHPAVELAGEALAVAARGLADVLPVAVEHVVRARDVEHEGGLQPARRFADRRVSLHRDPEGRPIRVGEPLALPVVKEAALPAHGRQPDALPDL